MKLSFETKVEIYRKWKYEHYRSRQLSLEYGIVRTGIEYIVHLAERRGAEKLKHTWTYYSPEFKKAAVERIFLGHESINKVSLDLGLSSHGILSRWIKEFIANGYTVIEKKKGGNPHGREKTEGPPAGERSAAKGSCGSLQSERDSYDTERILKKLDALVTERENREKKKSQGQ